MIDLVDSFKTKHVLPEDLAWMDRVTYRMPESVEELRDLLFEEWGSIDCIRLGADTETDSLNVRKARVVGISLSPIDAVACYIPIDHEGYEANLPLEEVREVLVEYAREKILVFYNKAYDASVWAHSGFDLSAFKGVEDAMVATYLSNVSDKSFTEGLKAITKRVLGIRMLEFSETVDASLMDAGGFAKTDPLESGAYAAADADMALRVLWELEEYWRKDGKPTIIWTIENEVIDVLRHMETNTVRLDEPLIEFYIQGALNDLDVREALIYDLAGEEFDIESPQQVAKIVFGKLKVKSLLKTPKGKQATGKKALELVADQHPVVSQIEAYRIIKKNVHGYLMKLLMWCQDEGPEARFHFNSILAPSGRLSSDSGGPGAGYTPMNIQNITSAESFKVYEMQEITNAPEFLAHLELPDGSRDLTEHLDHIRQTQKKRRTRKPPVRKGKGDLKGSKVLAEK